MIGFLSCFDENEKQAEKEKISFVHINSTDTQDVEIEMKKAALEFARYFNVEKVYLFFGKDEKIVYEFDNSLQS